MSRKSGCRFSEQDMRQCKKVKRWPLFLSGSLTVQSTLERKDAVHVAIIMDGNGRWASAKGLPRSAGHRAGVDALRRVCEAAPDLGVATLTVYAFSADNWRRPRAEVRTLMGLLRHYLQTEITRLKENDVRLSLIGRRDRLPEGLAGT